MVSVSVPLCLCIDTCSHHIVTDSQACTLWLGLYPHWLLCYVRLLVFAYRIYSRYVLGRDTLDFQICVVVLPCVSLNRGMLTSRGKEDEAKEQQLNCHVFNTEAILLWVKCSGCAGKCEIQWGVWMWAQPHLCCGIFVLSGGPNPTCCAAQLLDAVVVTRRLLIEIKSW